MKNRVIATWLPVALMAAFCAAGCQSGKTFNMYSGQNLPPDQLATLVIPWCIDLDNVDGVNAPSKMLSDEIRLVLKPGAHTLAARYSVLYPVDRDNTEKIVSSYVPVKFNCEAGKTYIICSEDPKSLAATRKYAAHVSLWIAEFPAKPGTSDVMQQAPALKVAACTTNATPNETAVSAAGERQNIQKQLQEVWNRADKQDRRIFLESVLQQPGPASQSRQSGQ